MVSILNTLPKGLLVEFYATELRLFDAIELRVFMRRGRPYGWVMDDYSKKLGEMFGGLELFE